MPRTDPHAPTNFDPTRYTFVGLIYIGPLPDGAWSDPSDDEALACTRALPHSGVHGLGQCDHCGSHISYCWIWEYEAPDGTVSWINVGSDCSFGRFQCPDRATFELATMRRKIAGIREYGRKSAAVREILDDQPALAEAIEWANEARQAYNALAEAKNRIAQNGDEDTPEYAQACREHATFGRLVGFNMSTIEDITSKLFRYGNISRKQIEFCAKLATEGAEKQARAKAVAEAVASMEPLTAGRASIEGTIKSAKFVESYAGPDTLKIAVSLDSGHTVYGTCPEALQSALNDTGEHPGYIMPIHLYRGARVRMTVTLDPSVGDNDFAVYKRPSKPELLNASEIAARHVAAHQEAVVQ